MRFVVARGRVCLACWNTYGYMGFESLCLYCSEGISLLFANWAAQELGVGGSVAVRVSVWFWSCRALQGLAVFLSNWLGRIEGQSLVLNLPKCWLAVPKSVKFLFPLFKKGQFTALRGRVCWLSEFTQWGGHVHTLCLLRWGCKLAAKFSRKRWPEQLVGLAEFMRIALESHWGEEFAL